MAAIRLNGNDQVIDDGSTISALLEKLGVPSAGTAVAINSEIVKREQYDSLMLKDGDKVEVLRAIGGG